MEGAAQVEHVVIDMGAGEPSAAGEREEDQAAAAGANAGDEAAAAEKEEDKEEEKEEEDEDGEVPAGRDAGGGAAEDGKDGGEAEDRRASASSSGPSPRADGGVVIEIDGRAGEGAPAAAAACAAPFVPVWRVWPANNKFFCGGRLMFGSDLSGPAITAASILLPSAAYYAFVLPDLYPRASFFGLLAVNLSLLCFSLASFLRTISKDPGIIPRRKVPDGMSRHMFANVSSFRKDPVRPRDASPHPGTPPPPRARRRAPRL